MGYLDACSCVAISDDTLEGLLESAGGVAVPAGNNRAGMRECGCCCCCCCYCYCCCCSCHSRYPDAADAAATLTLPLRLRWQLPHAPSTFTQHAGSFTPQHLWFFHVCC
jgi:hypothetical protein